MKDKISWHKSICLMLAGCVLYALALNLFYEDNHIAAGGLAGIAVILTQIIHIRVSVLVFLMNLPLLVLGAAVKGFSFIRNTIVCSLAYNALIEITHPLPSLAGHPAAAAVLGGIMMGTGMVFMAYANSSIGGTELIIRVLVNYIPHATIGRLCMVIDGAIAVLSTLVSHSVATGMYAVLALLVTSFCSDMIIKRLKK